MDYLELEENIIAVATPPGVGSIDILRLSGLNLSSVYKRITKKKYSPKPNRIIMSNVYSLNNNKILDCCMVSYFKAPNSFTGDDVLEINTHGGGCSVLDIMEDLISSGCARAALPGEFMFRAFYNRKIDLVQAEAMNDMILSETSVHKNLSLENIQGKLSNKIVFIRDSLIELLLIIEHELDFDESEIEHIANNKILDKMNEIKKHMIDMRESYFFSKTVRYGTRIMLLGKPNVGKSSIYNYLLGYNRVLVSNIPGTTRDSIESNLQINGNKIVLIDTAGFWESTDKLESMGINKTIDEINLSEIVVLVGERKGDFMSFDDLLLDKKTIKVLSKSDINSNIKDCLPTSIINETGFKRLSTRISTEIDKHLKTNKGSDKYFINKRQKRVLDVCLTIINELDNSMKNDLSKDVIANYLHTVVDNINEIITPIGRNDIINEIFSGFCVGK